MRSRRRRVTSTVALGVAIAAGAVGLSVADTVKLKNAGFESGTFAKWGTFNDGGGDWFVYRKGDEVPPFEPRQGIAPENLPKPPQGKRAAFLTQGAPGLNILHRRLRPKKDAEVNKLRFFLFYRNTGDQFHSPNSFEFGGGGMLPRFGGGGGPPNQQVRVDLIKRRAPLTSLEDRHILATLFRTRPGDDLRQRYSKVIANLTNLGIDKPFRLRIAEVDNQAPLHVGVDGLKLKFRP